MVERYIVIVDAESSILSNRPIKNYELDAFGIRSGSVATQLDIFKLTSQIRNRRVQVGYRRAATPLGSEAFNIQLENFIPDPPKRGIGYLRHQTGISSPDPRTKLLNSPFGGIGG